MRPVFVVLMGAVSFQKLDCGAPLSKRRHNGAASSMRWRFLRERMFCRGSGLTITSSSFARRFYRPQTLHDRLLLRRDKLWRGANATHKLRGRAEIHLEKPSGRERYRDQMRYVFGRENGPACIKVCLTSAIIIVDPLHSHHKLSGRIEQEAARAFVIKFYAEAKFKRASRFSRYRRRTWMQRPTLSLLASFKNS